MDVVDEVAVEASTAQSDGVQSTEGCRVAGHETEGQHILRETSTTAYHRIAAYATELVHQHTGTEDSIVVDDYLACQLRTVTDDATISDNSIMSHMRSFHQQVVIAYHGTPLGCCASVDGHVLAYLVVVAYFSCAVFATELEVLRNSTNDRTGKEDVSIADAGTVKDCHTVHQSVIVADDYSLVYIAEGTYLAVLADDGFRVYICQRTYHVHLQFNDLPLGGEDSGTYLLLMTCAVKVASATQFSPMKA